MVIIMIFILQLITVRREETLQKYVLGTDQNKFELKPDERCYWTGLVKVKDMEWKNSAQ